MVFAKVFYFFATKKTCLPDFSEKHVLFNVSHETFFVKQVLFDSFEMFHMKHFQ